ncbi:MAG: CatB-related O-acetyltransferase [Formivibrio sp.]|nr:CatB-related O-acetyltransferase [Formivibrio sp.]
MKLLKNICAAWERRKIKKLPVLHQGAARFYLKYKNKYSFGIGSYGLPVIHDWNEGTTLLIGSYCSISTNVQIFLGGNHRGDWISTYPFPAMIDEARCITDFGISRGSVIIGNDVWLCASCIILSGVTIGDGAIVAAGAVVCRDVEPYSIVAGNPARHVKWRYDEITRDLLLKSEWWKWPEQEIRNICHLLCSNDIDKFIEYTFDRKTNFV